MTSSVTSVTSAEESVRTRYTEAAQQPEAALCCATSYDAKLLEAIPEEVLNVDYGCGDPTVHLAPSETVLDLGSGSGKHCFMSSQVVGPEGQVIGVDMNDEMLALARRNQPEFASRAGHDNVTFRKARIQDLALDQDKLDAYLKASPVQGAADLTRLEAEMERLRRDEPLIADDSVDVVISNCVLNLVRPEDKKQLLREIFRVLKRGGRAVISDIVADEDIPVELQQDPELWSGCISGAFREDLFPAAFEEAGFYGVQILERQEQPWQTVKGIEFRSMTLVAFKGKEGPCFDQKHALVYKGPFLQVVDDDGHTFRRGVRTAVCEKTFKIFTREPYRSHIEPVEPRELVPLEEAPLFPCADEALIRHPRETKGEDCDETGAAVESCGPATPGGNGGCC